MTKMPPLLSVEKALAHVTAGLTPTGFEVVPIAHARGRVLARDLAAERDQPAAATSAMDGYAVRGADVGALPVTLKLIGAAPAGHAFAGKVGPGQAVRIFTGGTMPAGADAVVIQENTKTGDGTVSIVDGGAETRYVRPRGLDFSAGQVLLETGKRLQPRHVALAAAMNFGEVTVWRRPRIGILATGDELASPGTAGPGDIAASNTYGLMGLVEAMGGTALNLGIARDTKAALDEAFDSATGLDLLVTIGGASVGEYDLVAQVLGPRGLDLDFWRIAMRPGKPLMHGTFADASGKATRFIGLPGNPVSSLVCGQVFLKPMLTALVGETARKSPLLRARLAVDLAANDRRQDYMRTTLEAGPDGLVATPFARQDSSMLSNFSRADGFVVRPPHAPAAKAGTIVDVLPIDV
ncbi:Molybdopterin molybdenumtransferase [hydrothermal vent metagenome]|uniref:Molybdopterin molybdenumtransferase n=1 Tax=hydrothermal vent metagenome TaxID=652676 RepID=A0A3B0T7L8_9ZZZZ